MSKYRKMVEACAAYLKEGETPVQCIERERADSAALMQVLARRTDERDKAWAELAQLRGGRRPDPAKGAPRPKDHHPVA